MPHFLLLLSSFIVFILLPAEGSARECFSTKPCDQITVLDNSEDWFFDHIIKPDGSFLFENITDLHTYLEWKGNEYVIQRIAYERLKCVHQRPLDYDWNIHDAVSANLEIDWIQDFELLDNDRFILKWGSSQRAYNSQYGLMIADREKRQFIFGLTWTFDMFNPDWSQDIFDEDTETFKYHRYQAYWDEQNKKFRRVYLMMFIPPDYDQPSINHLLKIIKNFQRKKNKIYSLSVDPDDGQKYIADQDVKIHAVDCR